MLRIIINRNDLFTGIESKLLTEELFLNNGDSDKAKRSFTNASRLECGDFGSLHRVCAIATGWAAASMPASGRRSPARIAKFDQQVNIVQKRLDRVAQPRRSEACFKAKDGELAQARRCASRGRHSVSTQTGASRDDEKTRPRQSAGT